MPFTVITKPTQGDATKKSIIDALIENVNFLNGQQSSTALISNGSFEDDGDGDGIPDGWTRTLTGGSFLHDDTDQQHGEFSIKFTSSGLGGGYIMNDDLIPISPNREIELLWEMKSSDAGVRNLVEIYWYKADQTASVTTSNTLYDNSTTNPTAWTGMRNSVRPPTDARFARIRLTGCHSSDATAGSTWFDNVQMRLNPSMQVMEVLTASGTWTCPVGVHKVWAELWGGGGNGGAGGASGGGGGGGYQEAIVSVTPGTGYAYTIGAAAGNTTFAGITANGGTSGTAGAGGGGSGGTFGITGQNGQDSAGGGCGGHSPRGGPGGMNSGEAGKVPGGGGAFNSGAGAAGRIVLRY